jgi:hypothetical protein
MNPMPASIRRGTSCFPIAPVAPATNTLIIDSFIKDYLHPQDKGGGLGCNTSEHPGAGTPGAGVAISSGRRPASISNSVATRIDDPESSSSSGRVWQSSARTRSGGDTRGQRHLEGFNKCDSSPWSFGVFAVTLQGERAAPVRTYFWLHPDARWRNRGGCSFRVGPPNRHPMLRRHLGPGP